MPAESKLRSAHLRVAYLTNLYPAVSHSFIRREIVAVEAAGIEVQRWSIRRSEGNLPDSADQAERVKTAILLDRPLAILAATLGTILASPWKSKRALQKALQFRSAGLKALGVRLAHFAEACFLHREWKRAAIDHVHVHFGTNPTSVARLAFALGGPRYSFTAHGPDEFDAPERIGLGDKVADAAFAVAISNYGRSQLMRWAPTDCWQRIHVVRCGVDRGFLDHISNHPVDQRTVRFSCVARLAPQKGIPLLLKAAHILANEGLNFELVLAGDGPLRTAVEAQIRELNLTSKVSVLGPIDSIGVRKLISASRAMVLPSFAEGLPVVLMEALALGVPVITTAVAGITELVDSDCGWVVPAGSAERLAEAMREALTADEGQLTAMGKIGAARVREKHDSNANGAMIARLIKVAHAHKSAE